MIFRKFGSSSIYCLYWGRFYFLTGVRPNTGFSNVTFTINGEKITFLNAVHSTFECKQFICLGKQMFLFSQDDS